MSQNHRGRWHSYQKKENVVKVLNSEMVAYTALLRYIFEMELISIDDGDVEEYEIANI